MAKHRIATAPVLNTPATSSEKVDGYNHYMRTSPEGYIEPSFVRTARKEHDCFVCDVPINKGERYVEYVGETAGYQSGHRYHMACADECLKPKAPTTGLVP